MEQASQRINMGRHSGWSEEENRLLWETADEAQQQGLPLKHVFERIASQTGRRPNSIRNYYYAQVRQRGGEYVPAQRFVPFASGEVEALVERVLRARANGQSVRACLQDMSMGDHSLMLRYQNKYRSVLKNRPELIESITEKLRNEGIDCPAVEVRTRSRAATLPQACEMLSEAALSVSDAELIRACETITRLMLSRRSEETDDARTAGDRLSVKLDLYRLALSEKDEKLTALCNAADELTVRIKEYLILSDLERQAQTDHFCRIMSECVGKIEGAVSTARL
jgi:hypothetical protein